MTGHGIGIIGCGAISAADVKVLRADRRVRLVGCGDREPEAAEALARHFQLHAFPDADALLASNDVEIVLNLTPPAAHAGVSRAALRERKHIYTEKPFAASLSEGISIADVAADCGLRIGAAPDRSSVPAGRRRDA